MLPLKIRAKPSYLGMILIFILGSALGVLGLQHGVPQKIKNRFTQQIEKNRGFLKQELPQGDEMASQNDRENVHDKTTTKSSPETGCNKNPDQHDAALVKDNGSDSDSLSNNSKSQGVLDDVPLSEITDVGPGIDVGEDLLAASDEKNQGRSTSIDKDASEFPKSTQKRLEFDEKRAQQIKEVFVLRMEAMEYLECER